jgi:predicted ATPase
VLSRLDLHLFKCFDLLRLPLAPLTLLAGGNGSGKSSVLQAMVLLHQTIREHEWSTRLMLNGAAIKLGTVTDVVDKVNGRFRFEIGLTDDDRTYQWSFTGERAEMSMAVDAITVDHTLHPEQGSLRHLLPEQFSDSASSLSRRLRQLTYITAERVGPREVYSLEDRQIANVVGPEGEYTASVLHLGRDERVLDGLLVPDDLGAPPTRLRQVEARMRMFFPGCGLVLQQVPQANAVTLGLRTSTDTDFHRPINVGFGLTQVLPIIVAALSAAKDDILLIENPEVHLHPAGQSRMGQFLAEVASAGIQVIVETHSDHVLNGIRRSVRAGRIVPDHVAIHFFRPRSADAAQVLSPQLDNSGNIDTWPEGFFDQFDKDASYFAGWGE